MDSGMTTAGEYSDVEYVFEPHASTHAQPPRVSRGALGPAALHGWRSPKPTYAASARALRSGASGACSTRCSRPASTSSSTSCCAAAAGESGRVPARSDRRHLPVRPEHRCPQRRRRIDPSSQEAHAQLDVPSGAAPDHRRSTSRCASSYPPRACSRCCSRWSGGKLGPGLFVLPLLFVLQIVMNVGIALLVSTFVVLVPDGTNVMNYVTRILFFATPVIYPVSLLPEGARLLIAWQPLFALFASYQAVFSGEVPSPWPRRSGRALGGRAARHRQLASSSATSASSPSTSDDRERAPLWSIGRGRGDYRGPGRPRSEPTVRRSSAPPSR